MRGARLRWDAAKSARMGSGKKQRGICRGTDRRPGFIRLESPQGWKVGRWHPRRPEQDEAIAGGDAEIEDDEIGLLFASRADGSQAVAGRDNFESGSFEPAGAVSCTTSSSTIKIFFPAIATRSLCLR